MMIEEKQFERAILLFPSSSLGTHLSNMSPNVSIGERFAFMAHVPLLPHDFNCHGAEVWLKPFFNHIRIHDLKVVATEKTATKKSWQIRAKQ